MDSDPTTNARVIGPYIIRGRIAVGGMAEIFEAHPRGDAEQRLVIKLMLPEYARDPELLRAFLHEARLAQRLVHPCLVRVLDRGDEEVPFMAMEYVDGVSLAELLRHLRIQESALEPELCVYIVRAVLNALEYVHQATDDAGRELEVVHRDITPQNVLLSLDGVVKLGDFGIARSALQSARTRTGVIKGKLRYLAPEQVTGSDMDARTDLYSVGVLLFECLTGQPYYEGKSEVELIRAAEAPTPRRPAAVVPGLDPVLDGVVERAVQRFPEERWSDAAAMLRALAKYEGGEELAPALATLVGAARRAGHGPAFQPLDSVPLAETRPDTPRLKESVPENDEESSSPRSSSNLVLAVGAAVLTLGAAYMTLGPSQDVSHSPPETALADAGHLSEPSTLDPAALAATEATDAPTSDVADSVDAEGASSSLAEDDARSESSMRPRARAPRMQRDDAARPAQANEILENAGAENERAQESESAGPAESAAREALQRSLAQILEGMSRRGIRRSDLEPRMRRALSGIRSAAQSGGDVAAGEVQLRQLSAAIASLRVDGDFVRAKMERVNQEIEAARRRGADTSSVESLVSSALEDFIAGRHEASNRRLNTISDRIPDSRH